MKKTIPILLVGVLLLSGIGAVATTEAEEKLLDKNTMIFSNLIFEEKDEYININLKEATSINMETGKPMLPVVTKIYTFPLGTIINDIDVTFSGLKEYVLSKKIEPAPEPVPLTSMNVLSKQVSEDVLDEEVYTSYDLYPKERYTVRKTVGLNGDEHALYVTVRCYPIQYSPAKDSVYASEKIDINVEYQPPENQVIFPDVYDMVIITSEELKTKAQELADHKNTLGIETTVKTVESIYSDLEYSSGRDDPEKIKLYIQDALEDFGVHYVLLFGGRKGQTFKWHVPERVTRNWDAGEPGYASDLYYADIYKWNNDTKEWEFDDWDSNGNNIFAEFRGLLKDRMDFIPDVVVGRIPARSTKQARIIVDKIIKYETTSLGSWFDRGVVISGDTTPPVRSPMAKLGVYEGEIVTDTTATWLEDVGFTIDRLWTSDGSFAGPEDVAQAFKDGAGFIHMAGHGNPPFWGEFLPDARSEEEMIEGLKRNQVASLKNGDMLPIVVVGGCHNGQFNVTFANVFRGILRDGVYEYFQYWESGGYGDFWKREWVFSDLCSRLLEIEGGGSIATLGNTGFGLGYANEATVNGLEGAINIFFFEAYANQSKVFLGDAHSQSITDYINIVGKVNSDQGDRKTIEEWVLLGDPSLKIGGY